jgi:hypothetical protein
VIGALVQIGLGMALLGLLVLGSRLILEPARVLRLGLFRPWRGDPWPRGVQEEDPVAFDWAGAERRRRARLAPRYGDLVIQPTIDPTGPPARDDTTTDGTAVEDAPPGARVDVEPLQPEVRRQPH